MPRYSPASDQADPRAPADPSADIRGRIARLEVAVGQLGEALFGVSGPDRLRRDGRASLAALMDQYRGGHSPAGRPTGALERRGEAYGQGAR